MYITNSPQKIGEPYAKSVEDFVENLEKKNADQQHEREETFFSHEQEVPLKLKNGSFFLRKKDLSKAKEVFKEFYREKEKTKILERVKFWQEKIGVTPKEMKIMELQNR